MDTDKVEDLAAKREARRRRIVENAQNRLTRITGRELNAEEAHKIKALQKDNGPQEIYPDPEIERDVFVRQGPQLPAGLFAAPNGMTESLDDQQQQLINMLMGAQQPFGNGGVPPNMGAFGGPGEAGGFAGFAGFGGFDGTNPLFANLSAQATPPEPESRLRQFLKTKLHIAFLGLLSYALITAGEFKCSVFLIFLLWEVAEIFMLRQHSTNPSPLINIVFMFLGISPTKINVLLKWVQLLNKVLRDVAIFLFAFICCHLANIWWFGSTTTFAQKAMEVDATDGFDQDYGL